MTSLGDKKMAPNHYVFYANNTSREKQGVAIDFALSEVFKPCFRAMENTTRAASLKPDDQRYKDAVAVLKTATMALNGILKAQNPELESGLADTDETKQSFRP